MKRERRQIREMMPFFLDGEPFVRQGSQQSPNRSRYSWAGVSKRAPLSIALFLGSFFRVLTKIELNTWNGPAKHEIRSSLFYIMTLDSLNLTRRNERLFGGYFEVSRTRFMLIHGLYFRMIHAVILPVANCDKLQATRPLS